MAISAVRRRCWPGLPSLLFHSPRSCSASGPKRMPLTWCRFLSMVVSTGNESHRAENRKPQTSVGLPQRGERFGCLTSMASRYRIYAHIRRVGPDSYVVVAHGESMDSTARVDTD